MRMKPRGFNKLQLHRLSIESYVDSRIAVPSYRLGTLTEIHCEIVLTVVLNYQVKLWIMN
jgi:hypothetical protein